MVAPDRFANSEMLFLVRVSFHRFTLSSLTRSIITLPTSEKEIYKTSQVEVIGISPDPVQKQKGFVEKQKVPVRVRLHPPCYSPLPIIAA